VVAFSSSLWILSCSVCNAAQHAALAAQNGQPAPLGLDHAKLQQLARMLQVGTVFVSSPCIEAVPFLGSWQLSRFRQCHASTAANACVHIQVLSLLLCCCN